MTVTLEQAKHVLSELLTRVEHGETILIERDGKAVGKLGPTDEVVTERRRLGFMAGQFQVPDDFNTMCREEVEEAFYGRP